MSLPFLKVVSVFTAIAAGVMLAVCSVSPLSADEKSKASEASLASLSTEQRMQQGRKIYTQKCASCHGENGQGADGEYDEPLVGDDSIGELTRRITGTMPEGEAEECVGEDAHSVAEFIHHQFYSEAARIRNRPPRTKLSHLTGNQLRQSLADIYAHFSGQMWLEQNHGIRGTYFKGARWKKENLTIERTDSVIDFDWKKDGPGEGIKPEEFYVKWQGGIVVKETGNYEIVLRSASAFICKLGNFNRMFINNRVQSGDKTEFRKSIVLTAGRVYPFEIELYQRKRKTGVRPSSMSLSWVPPQGIEEIIPQRHLVATSPPATFSLQSNLPPDDRSYGYNRGLSVDRQWDESTTVAALEFAEITTSELWPRYERQHKKDANENRTRLRSFLTEIAEVAFRSSLDEETRKFYIDSQVDLAADDAEAIRRCLLVVLKSPRFLYPDLAQNQTPSQRAAAQLALTLYDSLPADEWLLKLVRKNELETEEQIRNAAWRMLGDYRVHGKMREMMYEWLNMSEVTEISKDEDVFPEFNAALVADLQASLNAFLDEIIWSEESDFRQLFLADWAYTTSRLEQFYGENWKSQAGESSSLTKSVPAPERRLGLLSHPYLMSRLAYRDSTSPIHRGVFLIRYLLGRTLRPPMEAFITLSPDLHPDMTTRERVTLQTSPQNCQVCHIKINGLGFVLENFDAVGRFREKEGEKRINSLGSYTQLNSQSATFAGATELAKFLANSNDTHRAFVNRAFQHFVKQPVAAYGPDRLDELTQTFRDNNFHIRRLLVEIAVIAATPPMTNSEEVQP